MDKITKEAIIAEEIKLLSKLYRKVDKNKRTFVNNTIKELAFMKATMQELHEKINTDGSFDLFQQGAQKFERESPACKTYNTMIKNYNATIKIMMDLLPEEIKKTDKDEFLDFLNDDGDEE